MMRINQNQYQKQQEPKVTQPSTTAAAPGEYQEIEFPGITIKLPKNDMKIWWKKAQKYMEIYLEDD